ncbi:hypothetical protein O181_017304 [Austropuccinia psidii MF-1]|uniref:Uncharacterized protein n=1 Tax=Austropuccinia psidii MF-1 TaxID=1389203 RepID=A0A9Q3C5H4_9BASI|nr:hypothetical protein [Austropuccinia psidii MF-1]
MENASSRLTTSPKRGIVITITNKVGVKTHLLHPTPILSPSGQLGTLGQRPLAFSKYTKQYSSTPLQYLYTHRKYSLESWTSMSALSQWQR